MKSSIVPVSCGVMLAAISAAGLSHWFSVREMVAVYQVRPPLFPRIDRSTAPAPAVPSEPKPAAPAPAPVVQAPPPDAAPANSLASKPAEEFFRTLLSEFKELKEENRSLQNQLEETNRDIMSMQFRLDTHSSEFRPLPATNELRTLNPAQDYDTGVLAPLEPVPLPAN